MIHINAVIKVDAEIEGLQFSSLFHAPTPDLPAVEPPAATEAATVEPKPKKTKATKAKREAVAEAPKPAPTPTTDPGPVAAAVDPATARAEIRRLANDFTRSNRDRIPEILALFGQQDDGTPAKRVDDIPEAKLAGVVASVRTLCTGA